MMPSVVCLLLAADERHVAEGIAVAHPSNLPRVKEEEEESEFRHKYGN